MVAAVSSDTEGEEGKGKRVYFTQMPIREVRADNERADACYFLSRSTGQERDVLDLRLLSSLRCLKWQQARNPADLKPPQKPSAPATAHAGTRQTCFAQVAQTLPSQPPCPRSSKAHLQERKDRFYSQISHGGRDVAVGYDHTGEEILQDSASLEKNLSHSFCLARSYTVCKTKVTWKALTSEKRSGTSQGRMYRQHVHPNPWLLSCLHKQEIIYFPHCIAERNRIWRAHRKHLAPPSPTSKFAIFS